MTLIHTSRILGAHSVRVRIPWRVTETFGAATDLASPGCNGRRACVCSQLGKSLGLSDIPTVVEARQSVGQRTCPERNRRTCQPSQNSYLVSSDNSNPAHARKW